MQKFLTSVGEYVLLMRRVLARPQKRVIFWNQLLNEIQHLGLESMGIVAIISVFMGAVVAIQTAYNIDSPLIPMSMVGFTTRQSVILEFSPTVISLILAGKVGSRIASEIGTMKVFSMWMGILGGWFAMMASGLVTSSDYISGTRYYFEAYTIFYAILKTIFFAFIISSVSGFYGYMTQGGALEVGQASTKAVVYSSILIILFNLILTQLLLT